ncbi:hypothetical protein [Candidatus Pyrohabitans sp.]
MSYKIDKDTWEYDTTKKGIYMRKLTEAYNLYLVEKGIERSYNNLIEFRKLFHKIYQKCKEEGKIMRFQNLL